MVCVCVCVCKKSILHVAALHITVMIFFFSKERWKRFPQGSEQKCGLMLAHAVFVSSTRRVSDPESSRGKEFGSAVCWKKKKEKKAKEKTADVLICWNYEADITLIWPHESTWINLLCSEDGSRSRLPNCSACKLRCSVREKQACASQCISNPLWSRQCYQSRRLHTVGSGKNTAAGDICL